MAKQRPQPKPKGQSSVMPPGTHRPAEPAQDVRRSAASTPSAPGGPQRRTTYFEAVAIYEKGLEALQQHDYAGAIDQFKSVLRLYPEEKELHERVRLYLNICERQVTPREAAPQSID